MTDSVGLPLLLELKVRGSVHVFLLAAGEERALTVGSAAVADLRLDEVGVAPVHFHFEREGDEVWLIPTSSMGRLRLDSKRVACKCRLLGQRCVLEVATLTIEVRWGKQWQVPADWLKTQPLDASFLNGVAEAPASVRMDVAYARQLPGEGDTTLIGAHGAFDGALETSFPTEQVPAFSPGDRQLVTERIPVIVAPSPAEGPLWQPVVAAAEVEPMLHASQQPAIRRASPPLVTTTQRIEVFASDADDSAGRADVASEREAGNEAWNVSWMQQLLCPVTRLGMATQQHPARVLAIALAVSLALGALVAGIASA